MKQVFKIIFLALSLSLFLATFARDKGRGAVEKLPNTIVLKWNEVAFEAFGGASYQHSLMASRINAMTHIAIHDALNAIQPKYAFYAYKGLDEKANPIAAASSAAHAVLLHEIPSRKAFLDSALWESLILVKNGDAKARGIRLGRKAADAIIRKRSNDGSAGDPIAPVPESTLPGWYRAVPPYNILFAPHWQKVKLFSLESKSQFRPVPPPALNHPSYAAAFMEVKETGKINSSARTAEQSAYTKFWYEFSEAGWNRVARTAIVNRNLNMLEAARVLALTDIAIADAYTAGWDAKFHYDFWRPYTAIRNAEKDGNDYTERDGDWEPAEPTPPVQDYPSTHSALGNAGAAVLGRLLGDNTSFTMTSFTALPAGSTRTFNSFSQAADENADSRVRAGIHFRFSCIAGQELGDKIGNWTVDHYLQPLK